MKEYYDQGHRDVQYNPGHVVWLRLQPYRQNSLVAYKLQLPPDSTLHNVFHVSLLMPLKGTTPPPTPFLPLGEDRRVPLTPTTILSTRQNQNRWEVLVPWTNTDKADATWEDVDVFQPVYPTFELEDKLFL
ncbi:uncharacterized protein [Aristolochia californica]|uniref:uncharacterized protein n=1 Tax=Aristolochia californica TaxID=171875 RepID=UPI0035E0FF7B